ncbi:TonB-dependent receptor [Thalassotalea atypica]|uniref:TonB-dependent receptor n=1 Tax=Thalassotalea atypica TaxID=2054316 RepID=UPI0025733C5C|nr:TonB-dependent receptor [Thalassotalea atypica]
MKLAKSTIALAISATILPSSLLAASLAPADSEKNAIESITVVGDFNQTNLQKTPASISIISDQDAELRNAQHLEEVIALAPNVNFASGSQRARYYQIRGIGERSQFNEPINPSVGVMIDGIDFTGIGSVSSMFDVSQAEVFRGPQGTRFGANALAGLINITTNAPTDEFEGKVKLTAGNYDSYGAGLALSGPATEAVNYRFAVEQYKSDGFIENTYLDVEDTNNRDELTARLKFAVEINPLWKLDISTFYFDFDNGYDAFSLDNTRETLSDQPGFDTQDTKAIALKSHYIGVPHFDLTTIVTFADSELGYGYDEDWSYVGLHPWEYSSTDHYFRDKTTSTAEFRFNSKTTLAYGSDVQWTAGLYFKSDDEDLTRQYTYLDSDFSSTFETETMAAYAQVDKRLSERVVLTAGLRVEDRSADYKNSEQLTFDPTDTMVGGKAVLSFQQNQDTFWYGSINRGYKAGGVNTDGTLPTELREFEPEYLWNYEIGYKVNLLDNKAYLRAAAFYMDRKDVQVKSAKDILRPDGSSEFIIYLGNAAEGENYGLELDGAWQINENFELYGALGLLETELTDYVNANGEDFSGREQAHAPQYTYNVGVNYYITSAWFFNLSIDGKDEFYFSDSHEQQSDSVNLVNASLTYSANDWQVKAWARNLTDENYKTRGFYFGNDPRDGYTAKSYHQYGEPAVFGVSLDYQF